MNGYDAEHRFRAWLARRAPRSAPAGLLPRTMAIIEREPTARRRRAWPFSRSVVLIPAYAAVVLLAIVVTVALTSLLGPGSSPGAATSSSTQDEGSSAPTTEIGSASASPSAPASAPAASSSPFAPTATRAESQHPTAAPTVIPPAPTPRPTVDFVCSSTIVDPVTGAMLRDGEPYQGTRDMCVNRLTWTFLNRVPGAGVARLILDGQIVFVMHMDQWMSTGEDGGGSGERSVVLDPPWPVAAGQTLALDLTDCPDCVLPEYHIGVWASMDEP